MLKVGSSAQAKTVVSGADLASTLNQSPDDAFPAVYATSKMIGLMELAASRVLIPILTEGQLSVGVTLDVAHTAATPIGVEVSAEATYLGAEGKFHLFEVVARDLGGEIGRGRHKRAIVAASRLVEGASRRCQPRDA